MTGSMHPFIGHSKLQAALGRACHIGNLPSSLLIHGMPGVGKQHLALWIAQVLLCQHKTPSGPCMDCKSCVLSLRIEHPDLHWFFPVPRPKKARPDNLGEVLENARQDSLIDKRKTFLRPISISSEPGGIYLATIKYLRSQVYKRPSMGFSQVFIIGDAQGMVSRNSSSEAANALLKILEEPPRNTFLIITCDVLRQLPATIISRTVPVHLAGIPTPEVKMFLLENLEIEEKEADKAARLSRGSIGRSLGFLKNEGNEGTLELARQKSFHFLRACLQGNKTLIYQEALQLSGSSSRTLGPVIDSLGEALRDLALFILDDEDKIINTDTLQFLENICSKWTVHPLSITESFQYLDQAKEQVNNNINPQLIITSLLINIQEKLSASSK
jgi:DNA polymerase-3 subunit delta'